MKYYAVGSIGAYEMSSENFDEGKNYRKIMEIYFQSMNNLYDKTKNDVIKEIIEKYDLKGKTVLDVGCGGGYWTRFFVEHGAEVYALDVNPSKVKAAILYLKRKNMADKACFFASEVTSLNLKINFDLIFAKDVIEHVKDDVLFLRKLSSLLKSKGVIILSTQNAFSLNFLIEGCFNRALGNKDWCGWDPTHLRFYTLWSLRRKAEAASLKISKYYGSYHIPYRFITNIIYHKVYEHRAFHILDKHYDKFPVDVSGWALICEIKKK